MKMILISLWVILFGAACQGQERPKFKERFFMKEWNTIYHYIQGYYQWSPSNSILGIQYRRVRPEIEGGVISFTGARTVAAGYTQFDGDSFLHTNLESSLSSWPFTALIRIGVGLDFNTNFKGRNYLSIYPSVGFDLGAIEISYAYLINGKSPYVYSDHRLKIGIGLWLKSKYAYR